MHFLFSSLSIKGLYMFRSLLAHFQEVLHKQHLVYCVRVMSVGCNNPGAEQSRAEHSRVQQSSAEQSRAEESRAEESRAELS
jgi:hypothetical protein